MLKRSHHVEISTCVGAEGETYPQYAKDISENCFRDIEIDRLEKENRYF